jgi:hypothetical protein
MHLFEKPLWMIVSLLVLLSFLPQDGEPAAGSKEKWSFKHQIIYPNVPGADEAACGNIDGDGNVDILCSQSEGTQLPIRWYRNPGGSQSEWKSSGRITPVHDDWKGEQGWMGSWLGDLDGDGDLDVVSGAKGGFSGISHPVCWFENVKGDGTVWAERLLPVSGDHIDNCRTADLNGDGRDDVIVQKYHGDGVYYVTCPVPADPQKAESWQAHKIGTGAHGLCLADVDGDGRLDVTADNRWLRNPGDPAVEDWQAFMITDAASGVKNAAGDINGNGRIDAALSSEEGRGVWWFESPSNPASGRWIQHTISEDYVGNHTLWFADFDDDGHLDILVAEMHTKGKHRVAIFENADGRGGSWIEHIIATTGSHNAIAVDVNGDGKTDVIGCNFAISRNPLEVWYNDLGE